ncbi:9682_t:CDS:2 [Gigaspora rosea]|nr:9682_t:CDS:2 [Gigaspora rosea]
MVRGHNLSIDTVAASLDNNESHSIIDDDDYLTSSPSIIEEEINFSLVYALHSFQATVEGQANVVKGDSLSLLDDSNSYWWLVKVLPSDEIGYIPAENIETPYERLARLNKHRNIGLSSPHHNVESDNSLPKPIPTDQVKAVTFASPLFFIAEASDDEYYEDDEEHYIGRIEVTTQSVVQHEKVDDVQLVNEPEELKDADKQVIDPENDHSQINMNQNNHRGSNNPVKVTENEIVEIDVKRTDDRQYEQEMNQHRRQEKNQQHRQEYRQEKNQQYRPEKNQQYGQSQQTLGSDFIDFSDEDDEGNKMKSRYGRSFENTSNNIEPIRANIVASEPIKNKKEEEPVKQVSSMSTPASTPASNPVG